MVRAHRFDATHEEARANFFRSIAIVGRGTDPVYRFKPIEREFGGRRDRRNLVGCLVEIKIDPLFAGYCFDVFIIAKRERVRMENVTR